MVNGTVRPWGLGPRVPMYVVSPWSKGGWVDSQVFDHTSVGQFLEKRFGVTIPAISPWHRAICGDLTSAFDFSQSNELSAPQLPYVSASAPLLAENRRLAKPSIPLTPQPLFQEQGTRPSRALPYMLNVSSRVAPTGTLELTFLNEGTQGAVFHVYDRLHLDRIPRRYTVEAGRQLGDEWRAEAGDEGKYDLRIYGPNGFVRELRLDLRSSSPAPEVSVRYDVAACEIQVQVANAGSGNDTAKEFIAQANAYRTEGPSRFAVGSGERHTREWPLKNIDGWYDFTIATDGFEYRIAGRLETGVASTSDPALAI
jgi:phospholipase C